MNEMTKPVLFFDSRATEDQCALILSALETKAETLLFEREALPTDTDYYRDMRLKMLVNATFLKDEARQIHLMLEKREEERSG